MKKIIITIIVAFLIAPITNAQIIKPKLSNTNINIDLLDQNVKGLKVKNLDKMSVKNFAKLKIPMPVLSKDVLNKEPTRSWVITPLKLNDAHLKFNSSFGTTSQRGWEFGKDRPAFIFGDFVYFYGFTFSFRVTGGIEYRLKLKHIGTIRNSPADRVTIAINNGSNTFSETLISTEHSSNGEFYFVFKEERSKNLTIRILGIERTHPSENPGNPTYPENLMIKEVRIDRIN